MKQGNKLALVFFGLLAVLWLAVAPAGAQDEEGFQVSAKSFVLMDAKTGHMYFPLTPSCLSLLPVP